jgi:hypothetical protein
MDSHPNEAALQLAGISLTGRNSRGELVPQLGDDVDHNPTRKRGILPAYRPSLTLRVGISGILQSRLSPSCGTSL